MYLNIARSLSNMLLKYRTNILLGVLLAKKTSNSI